MGAQECQLTSSNFPLGFVSEGDLQKETNVRSETRGRHVLVSDLNAKKKRLSITSCFSHMFSSCCSLYLPTHINTPPLLLCNILNCDSLCSLLSFSLNLQLNTPRETRLHKNQLGVQTPCSYKYLTFPS